VLDMDKLKESVMVVDANINTVEGILKDND